MNRVWNNRTSVLTGIAISLGLVVVTWLVYLDGGAGGGLIHLYYVPIVFAAYVLGDLGGIVVAFAAALLASLLPAKIVENSAQSLTDIVIRGVLFYAVGILTARLFAKLRERREEASSLLEVSYLVNSSLRPTEVLRTIAETAVHITSAKACCIRLLSPAGERTSPALLSRGAQLPRPPGERGHLVAAASYGLSLDFLGRGPVRLVDSPVYQEVMQGRTMAVLDLREDPRFPQQEDARREGLVSLLAIPLSSAGQVVGVLGVYSGVRHMWERRERRLLRAFAEQASMAIHNARLHEDLRRSYWATVSALARAIEAKDPYTMGHSERVTDYALRLGRAAGLDAEAMETLRFAATLHDIGRIGVSGDPADLPRPRRAGYGVEEAASRSGHLGMAAEVMDRMHPLIGISILQPVVFLAPALAAVRYHHERWDGKGYPEGLAGEAIPFLARLVAVANTYDRARTGGPGRPAYSEREAADELRRSAGTALDPKLTEQFLAVL